MSLIKSTLELMDEKNDIDNQNISYAKNYLNELLNKSNNTNVFTDGLYSFVDRKIINKRMEVLEHGELKNEETKGIILHQTNGQTAMSTLARYHINNLENIILSKILGRQAVEGIGAHFLISPSGTIYQTARIDRICYHVGPYINSFCHERKTCETKEGNTLHFIQSNFVMTQEGRWSAVTDIEKNKPWYQRYPKNNDSIGIEIVGMPPDGEHYPKPSGKQMINTKWLVDLLLKYFNLGCDRVFAHGQTSPHKKSSEGLDIALEFQNQCPKNRSPLY